MIIYLNQNGGEFSGNRGFPVTITRNFVSRQIQQVDYVEPLNANIEAYNYGSDYDKFQSTFTIEGLKTLIKELHDTLRHDNNQVEIDCEDYELIFGAGIDYSERIICNITNYSRVYSQENLELSRIELQVEAIGVKVTDSSATQLQFKSGIPDGMPFDKLNYQTPVEIVNNKKQNDLQTDRFGDYGMITKVDAFDETLSSVVVRFTFAQDEQETAQIEKFVNTQRSDLFFWEGLECLDLLYNQDIKRVMITGFATQYVNLNDWRVSLEVRFLKSNFESRFFTGLNRDGASNNNFVSFDDGENWKRTFGVDSVRALKFGNRSFVAVGNDQKIYVSFDGEKYEATSDITSIDARTVNFGFDKTSKLGDERYICIDYLNGTTGYYSDDYGQSWQSFALVSGDVPQFCLQSSYRGGYHYLFCKETTWKVYRSESGIDNYQLVYTSDATENYCAPVNGGSGLAFTSGGALYKTSDGTTWSKVSMDEFVDSCANYGFVGLNQRKYVFMGGNFVALSSDLINFDYYTHGQAALTSAFLNLGYNGEYFATERMRSTDGVNWFSIPVDNIRIEGTG